MTNEIMSAIFSLCLTGGGENALLNVTAVDDAGCAISNAEVTVCALCKYYFGVGGRSSDWAEFKSRTDADGAASVKFKMYGNRFKWSVRAEGYYSLGQKAEYFQFKENKDLTCMLLESERKVRAVLFRKRNPQPMYAYSVASKLLPSRNGCFGFDLQVGDWVAPYGKGLTPDFNVNQALDVQSNMLGKVEFPAGAGGYLGKKADNEGFPSVYEADTNATYNSVFEYMGTGAPTNRTSRGNAPIVERDEYMILRTRVEFDNYGKLKKANYAKIYGPFVIGNGIRMSEVIFNDRVNDNNLELDNSRNKIKRFRSAEFRP